jgi:hypothetical protein
MVLMASEWLSAEDCVRAGPALEAVPDDSLMAHAHGKPLRAFAQKRPAEEVLDYNQRHHRQR